MSSFYRPSDFPPYDGERCHKCLRIISDFGTGEKFYNTNRNAKHLTICSLCHAVIVEQAQRWRNKGLRLLGAEHNYWVDLVLGARGGGGA